MSSTAAKALMTGATRIEAAALGTQKPLEVLQAPAGAEDAVGQSLLDLTLTVQGAYVFLLPLWGLASVLNVHVKPQLTAPATLTSAGPDALALLDPENDDPTAAEVILAGSSDGALSDDTLQSATIAPNGCRYALYTLTLGGGGGSATFDVAEYTGL